MIDVSSYLLIVLGVVLVNNVVLVRMLGLCPLMGSSKRLDIASGMAYATAFVLTLGCGLAYLVDHYLLQPFDLTYLRTLSFIFMIASIVQFSEKLVQKLSPLLHQILGIYLPLITTNCAVLGVPLLNVAGQYGFFESLLFGFSNALGFSMIMVLFASIRERLVGADVPVPFQGVPIALLTAGLMSLAFMGFSGLVKL